MFSLMKKDKEYSVKLDEPISSQSSISIPPENVRKQEVFQGL